MPRRFARQGLVTFLFMICLLLSGPGYAQEEPQPPSEAAPQPVVTAEETETSEAAPVETPVMKAQEPQESATSNQSEEPQAVVETPEAGMKATVSQETESTKQTQGAEESGVALDEIVVSAVRRESSWKDAPAMVTVIGKEELELATEKTVDDFLKRVPSVSFSREHVAECGPGRDITLRGIHEQKRTLVLVDGVPQNDGVTGAVNWSMIPKESVERIEIVRGPMSALYGSGAMGGVIHIITKKPKEPNETLVKAGYGSLNTMTANVLQGGMFEKGGYWIGGNLYKTDGYKQAKERQAYHVKNERTDMSLMGRFFLLPDNDSKLTLDTHYVNEDFSRGIRTDEQNNQVADVNLTYERDLGNAATLTGTVYGRFFWREVDLGARPDYTQHDHTEFDDTHKFGELFQASFKVADFNTVSVGVDTSYTKMKKHNDYALVDRKAKAEGNQLLTSLFAQDEMEFKVDEHKFLLTPGVRMDYIRSGDGKSSDTAPGPNPAVDETYQDRSWTAVNPKLAFVYRYDDLTTVRASVGRSFAAPTLFELYTVFTRGPMLMYGNPDLDPESAWSGEVGIDQWFLKNFVGRLTGYYTRGEDFIGSRSLSENENKMDNITEIQTAGLDAELRYDINKMWTLFGGYTFNHATVLKDDVNAATEGNRLPFEPMHRARLGVTFQYERWIAIDLSGRYEGERFVDFENTKETKLNSYMTLDLALSGNIVEQVRWMLTFENLLNEKYDIYSVPTDPAEAPGLLVTGSLALMF